MIIFSEHALYGWLAHYFKIHHVLQAIPLGPLMVRYSGFETKHNNIGKARKLIHEGKISNLGASC